MADLPQHRGVRHVAAMSLCAVAALTGGCTADHQSTGQPAPPDTTVRTPAASDPPSTTPRTSRRAQALAAYRGMWHSFVKAAKTSDADAHELTRYSTGRALKLIRSGLRSDHKNGVVTRGRLQLKPRITEATPSSRPGTVKIVDCVDDSHWLLYTRSGDSTGQGAAGQHHAEALVKPADGTWKVTVFFIEKAGTC